MQKKMIKWTSPCKSGGENSRYEAAGGEEAIPTSTENC